MAHQERCQEVAATTLIAMTKRAHLSPTVVIDKNGKTTTVHRKLSSQGNQKAHIPAPAVAAKAKKDETFKPTATQLRPVRHDDYERIWEVNTKLLALTGSTTDDEAIRSFSYTANDLEFYSVRGAVGRVAASMLLKHGIRSGEEAKSFLKENDLEILIQDRSSLMEKILRKKIPATVFSEFNSVTSDITGFDDDDIADALGIYMIAGYRNARSTESPAGMVARGQINAADLRALGVKHIGKNQSVLNSLVQIKRGTANYDAAELRRLLDAVHSFAEPEQVIDLAAFLDVDSVIALRSKGTAHRTLSRINGRVAPEEIGVFLTYVDKGDLSVVGSGIKGDRVEGAVALYRAGVDPVAASERLREGATVENVIGTHLNVHASVVGGWL